MTQPLRAMEVTGADAPDRTATLKVSYQGFGQWDAYWEQGYCGCVDCRCLIGRGNSAEEAVSSYWELWEEKYVH